MQTKQRIRKSKRLNATNIQPFFQTATNGQKVVNTMTYYDTFISKIQCEEFNEVSPEEYDEVMMLMAQESEAQEGYSNWSNEDQRLWEAEQERLKLWTAKYSPINVGDSYAGIAI